MRSSALDPRGTFLQLPKIHSRKQEIAGRARSSETFSVVDRRPLCLGTLDAGADYLALSRIKLWWLAPFWGQGRTGSEIPPETSFLLVRMAAKEATAVAREGVMAPGGHMDPGAQEGLVHKKGPPALGPGACGKDPSYTYSLILPLNDDVVRASIAGAAHRDSTGEEEGAEEESEQNEALYLCMEEWRQSQVAAPSSDCAKALRRENTDGDGGQEEGRESKAASGMMAGNGGSPGGGVVGGGEDRVGVEARELETLVLIASGDDPFELLQQVFAAAADKLQTFRPLADKELPPMLDFLGWCVCVRVCVCVREAGRGLFPGV